MDQIHHYTLPHKMSSKTNHTTKISVYMLLNMLQHNLMFLVESICVCFHFCPNKECVLNLFTSQCTADCQRKETMGDYFYKTSFLQRFWQSVLFCYNVIHIKEHYTSDLSNIQRTRLFCEVLSIHMEKPLVNKPYNAMYGNVQV